MPAINDKVAIAIQRLRTSELAEAPCDDHINYDNVPYKNSTAGYGLHRNVSEIACFACDYLIAAYPGAKIGVKKL